VAASVGTGADMYQPYSASPYLPAPPPSNAYSAQAFDARLHADPADGDRGVGSAATAALGQHGLDHVHHSKVDPLLFANHKIWMK
jgi:hypothetical protein